MNILFTSVGRRSYLIEYFKEVLGEEGQVHAANSSDTSPAFLVADKSVVTPLIYDENYIPFLLEYCKKNQINAIISLFDIDLPILSRNKKQFSEIGVKVIVSEPAVIDVCNDKWKTYLFLNENNFCVPKTFITLYDAVEAIEKNEVTFPLMVKPRWGMGSISIFEAENVEELRVFYEKIKRNIQNTYLKYESATEKDACVLIQEKIHGQEYGLDVINDLNGIYQNTICKKKYAMRSGETDCAITVDNELLNKIGAKLSCIFQHVGNLDVDVFLANDKVYVLEMNARFGGGYPFSHIAGVDLPKAIVTWLNGEKIDKDILLAQKNVMAQKDIQIVRLR